MAKISDGIAILDSIASRNMGFSPDVMGFDMFSVEMTESLVHVADDGIVFAAMVRRSGMKESESKLWKLSPATAEQQAKVAKRERQTRLDCDAANYASGSHEMEVDPIQFILGMVQAFQTHNEIDGLTVAEVFDITPDMFSNASGASAMSNRRVARTHDRARRRFDRDNATTSS